MEIKQLATLLSNRLILTFQSRMERGLRINDAPSLWTWARDSILLVASIITIFGALGNSITWYLQQFWGASGSFWQSFWDNFLARFGDDQYALYIYGTNIITFGLYWGVGLIYILMDLTNRPSWLRKYKVQPGQNEPVDSQRLKLAIVRVIFNQIVVSIPFSVLCFYAMKARGLPPVQTLPTFSRVLFELGVFILIEEIGFYYSHRLFHHRRLYKHIHKKHHEWIAPIAIIAIYCHPLEHLLSNLLPLAVGPAIMGSHVSTTWLWYSMAILKTLNDHSDYHFPFFPSPEAHDFHHLKFTECYGVLGILDYLHGTDKLFRSSASYQRHLVSLKTDSLRDQFPDGTKQKVM